MDRDSRKSREENLVDGLVIQNLVGRENKTILDRRHDLVGLFVIQRQDTVQNSNLPVSNEQPIDTLISPRHLEEALRPLGGIARSS